MKANELRIGNWYVHPMTPTKAPSKMLDIDFISGFTEQFKPIPLTEEWLLKFGYKHFQSEHIYSEWALVIDGILKYKIFQSSYTGVETFTFPNSNKPVTLKHVHQLQNLYFALTGNELTIKEQ